VSGRLRFALVGRPNCGKSTLFNQVAGYKAETGNFHGTTVTFTESKVRVSGDVVELVDLPGTYTMNGSNPAEAVARDYLVSNEVDVVINVADATHLAQSLELTLELLPLKRPMILALNMIDESTRLGIHIDGPALEKKLGVKVLPLVASKGRGVRGLFLAAKTLATGEVDCSERYTPPSDDVLERHHLAQELAEAFTHNGPHVLSLRDRLDDILLHPVWGYVALLSILLVFFELVYSIGRLVETPLLNIFSMLTSAIVGPLRIETFWGTLVNGILQGVTAGISIVLPYLVPFLLMLGLLEDIGYLPRMAFLMDALMHRIGLHGKAIVPFILGYGCNVPAVMSTRTLEEPRDRFLAAALSTLVPCAARLAVVFGLVAFYLGPLTALGLYIFNLFVIAFTGRVLTHLLPEDTPGLILEMPPYRIPTLKAVFNKAWFRVKEFAVEAWPTLIVGSGVLAILSYYHLTVYFNVLALPVTWTLGLPMQTGVPLIFGILRKELSLVMLGQALGSMNFASVMTPVQSFTYAVFVVFYVPCLATLMVLRRELGTKSMLWITALTVVVAMVAALLARGVALLFLF